MKNKKIQKEKRLGILFFPFSHFSFLILNF